MPTEKHGAKKSKKQRKFGRWSRSGRAAIKRLRIERNKAAKLARYTKWLTKRRKRYGLPPSSSITAFRKFRYAQLTAERYGDRP